MGEGWTLNDIDEMDINWYLELLLYKTNKGIIRQNKALDDAGL